MNNLRDIITTTTSTVLATAAMGLLWLLWSCTCSFRLSHEHSTHVDVPFGTPLEVIEKAARVKPDSKLSSKTPPTLYGTSSIDTVAIVIDFIDPGQGSTSDVFGNVVASIDWTDFGVPSNNFNEIVKNRILDEVNEDFYDELLGTDANSDRQDLEIIIIEGDIGTPPVGISEYFFVQVGRHNSGPHGQSLGVAFGSSVRNEAGVGPNPDIEIGDVVASVFVDNIQGIGDLEPSNALSSGNLELISFAISGTLSHEIGHTISLSHISSEGSEQPTNGAFPIMGTGAIDLPNQARITDREFSFSGVNAQSDNAPVFHIAQLVNALGTDADCSFDPRLDYQTENTWTTELADVNDDGFLDAIVSNRSSNNIEVRLNDGSGGFPSGSTYSVDDRPEIICVGDIDDDGDLDIAAPCSVGDSVSILRNNGNGVFGNLTILNVVNQPREAVLADFNNDSRLDLAVVSQDSGANFSTVSVFQNFGNGVFGGLDEYLVPQGSIRLKAADIDNDQNLDLVSLSENLDQFTILEGSGNGNFQSPFSLNAFGDSPQDLTINDFDNDGWLDIAICFEDSESIVVVRNEGNFIFDLPGLTYDLNDDGVSICSADIDHDGDNDLCVANQNETVSVFLNHGLGSFNPVEFYPAEFVRHITCGDLDNDGDIDVVTSSSNSDEISIFQNNCSEKQIPDPPVNDQWTNSIGIFQPLPETVFGTNVGATVQADEQQLNNVDATVWWFVESPGSGNITVNTFGSTFDTQLDVFTGFENGFENLEFVGGNNNSGGQQSEFVFQANEGQCYEIRVGGFNGDQGAIQLNLSFEESLLLGDVNCDGVVDLLDIAPFVDLIVNGEFSEKADFNLDSVVDLLDVAPFVDALTD